MFIENKYTNWYFNIITSRQNSQLDSSVYYEKHHIIPRSLGGSNIKDNLVYLTFREHFIIHWLLTKMCENRKDQIKMKHAFGFMVYGKRKEYHNITSIQYSAAKNQKREALNSEEHKHRLSKLKKGIPRSEETKQKIREKRALQKPMSEETKKKIGNAHRGIPKSDNFKQTMSILHKGKTVSLQTKEKLRMVNLGKKQSAETISKKIANQTGKTFPKKTYPHCGKIGGGAGMTTYHFNNCKAYSPFSPSSNHL